MGGVASPGFQLFKKLFKEGFEAARKHSDEIISELSYSPPLPFPLFLPPLLTDPPLLSFQLSSSSCSTVRPTFFSFRLVAS